MRWFLPLLVVGLTACAGSDGIDAIEVTPTETTTAAPTTTPPGDTAPGGAGDDGDAPLEDAPVDDPSADDPSADAADDVPVDEILAELQANGFCDPVDVEGPGDVGTTTAMHFVVDGRPVPPCFGRPDDRLDDAWSDLEAIAPADYLDDISLLAGYEACEGCDTLAFVTSLDDGGSFFLMAIDVTAAQDDPDELLLTLVHELSHVFTQDPDTQLDIDTVASACATYHNGNGCVTEGSYLWDWMTRFWNAEDLTALNEGEADPDAGEERCELDADYTGSYGASSPEEDFAEVFAAYVFAVDFGGDIDDKLAYFDEYDEFRRIRDRVDGLGLSGLPNTFERCG